MSFKRVRGLFGRWSQRRNDGAPDGGISDSRSAVGSGRIARYGVTALGGAGAAALLGRRKPQALPVVIVHGILDSAANMEEAAGWVREALGSGAYVRCIEIGNGEVDSLTKPMEWQLVQLAEQLKADVRLRGGFNMIGYSQGSLLARGFVQRYNEPRVHTLVSWVGPQAGQYGCPDWEANWPELAASTVVYLNQLTSAVWYSEPLQATLSFSNYWRDPLRLELYRQKSTFLADLNNEFARPNKTYSSNLKRLEAFVLVASAADTIIVPRESSWFGFYAPNSTSEILPLRQSALYRQDRLGLRALDRAGKLHFASCECKHREVPSETCRLQVWDAATKRYLVPQGALPGLLQWLRPKTLQEKESVAMEDHQAGLKSQLDAAETAAAAERAHRLHLERENARLRAMFDERDASGGGVGSAAGRAGNGALRGLAEAARKARRPLGRSAE